MRILYGVNGEGMGHAMRSAVVAEHLLSKGHQVQFVSNNGKALKFLENKFPGRVVSCVGLNMVLERNKVNPLATFGLNVARQFLASPFLHLFTAVQVRVPDVVISDFEPWSARFAGLLRKPLIAIDNVHFMSRCRHPSDVVFGDRQAASLMFPIVSEMVPKAKRYLITTIARAVTVSENTTLHAPIIRPKVLSALPEEGEHIVGYFNDKADHRILGALSRFPKIPFRIYGFSVQREATLGNLTVLPAGDGFVKDLASSRAVIGGAGFTLLSEALHLRKPMLALPFAGQFEQILNANYLEHLGYGARARQLDVQTVGGFLARLSFFKQQLASYPIRGNEELLRAVELAIA